MAPKRRCPVCGSKQWHKEPSSGLIACSEGHILQNYRNETNEAEDLGNHMMKKRTLKSNREKEERRSKADPKLYHGSRGRYFYFQCQQLILRKQITALTRIWNLPVEFEMICRDIWALHLSMLPEPPPAEPLFGDLAEQHQGPNEKNPLKHYHTSGSRYYRSQSESPSRSRPMNVQTRASTPDTRPTSPAPSESPSSASDDNDDDESGKEGRGRKADHAFKNVSDQYEGETDPELAELLRQNSESEHEEEDGFGSGDDKPASSSKAGQRRKRGHYAFEEPANNIAVLVVACWTLRLPILYRDFTRHIESYELPYLDPVRLLPRSMVAHLTKHNIQALSPPHAPKTLVLHGLVSHLAKQLYHSYGIVTPEANAAPILWRVIESLGGTPTLYDMTKRLSFRLSLPLALHHSLVPGLRQMNARDPEIHKYDNVPVEVSLMAAAIVVLKMVYGLDGKERSPKEPHDPAFALPRKDEFLKLVTELQKKDLEKEAVLSNSENATSAEEVDEAKLDEYLAFCERTLLRPDEKEDDNIVASHFPVSRTDGEGESVRVADSERRPRLWAPLPGTGDGGVRPGAEYRIYDSSDVLGSMEEESETVIGRAALLTGVGETYICGIVEKYERRVIRWFKRGEK